MRFERLGRGCYDLRQVAGRTRPAVGKERADKGGQRLHVDRVDFPRPAKQGAGVSWLKADFHAHCGDDPRDVIDFSAEMLVDAAAQLNLDVLAIACHERVVYGPRLADYAAQRGVLLLPAVELCIEGKHVVVLNPDPAHRDVTTFAALRRVGRCDGVIMAPHPYYPSGTCLGAVLERHADLFDVIEYCSMYGGGLNPNRRAQRFARRRGLPLAGTSDTHTLPYSDSTHSWIAAEPTIPAVIEALRAGRVQVATRPRPVRHVALMGYFALRQIVWRTVRLRQARGGADS